MEKTRKPKGRTIEIVRHVKVETKVCPQCGTRFEGIKTKKFCSRSCVQKASYHANEEKRRADRMKTYYEQRIAEGKATRRRKPAGEEAEKTGASLRTDQENTRKRPPHALKEVHPARR